MLAFLLLSLVLASDFEEENKSLRLINAQLQKTLEAALGEGGISPESMLEEGFEAARTEAVPLYELDDVEENERRVEFEVAEADDSETEVGGCESTGTMCADHKAVNNAMAGVSAAGGTLAATGAGVAATVKGVVPGAILGVLGGILSVGSLSGNIITNNVADCNKCCSKANYWWSKASMRCGTEPRWRDGTLCGIGTTCKACKNSYSYWFSKAMTACGREKCWRDGSLCGLGTTCKACCRKAGYWYGKAMTACGREPCWGSGTWCLHGTSCNRCCKGAHWWSKCK